MVVFSLINNKGGVAKSTSAVNLGAALARSKKRVLLVDTDPQGSASIYLGKNVHLNNYAPYPGLFELLVDDQAAVGEVIQPTHRENLDIITGSWELGRIGEEFVLPYDCLRTVLKPVKDQYDYIILDTPPSSNRLIKSTLELSDFFVVPVEPYNLAVEGIMTLLNSLHRIRDELLPEYAIGDLAAIIITRTLSPRYNIVKSHIAHLKEKFGAKVLEPDVPQSVKVAESVDAKTDIFEYSPKSKPARAYRELAKQICRL